jgi:ppGpp synthetase/RelA/SpoT-type nucleotidyltranferase
MQLEKEDIKKYIEWYEKKHSTYELLARKAQDIILELLKLEGVKFLSVEHRAKTIKSFEGKLNKGINYSPENMQDLAGVRVTTYVLADVEKVEKVLRKYFEIDEHLSSNTSKRLGKDKVGYRSVHYVVMLSPDRLILPEYSPYKGLKIEIQIRTILQHAWAQIGHDETYKQTAVLPPKIERDFMLLAGLLEIADNEFNRTSLEIEKYRKEVASKAGNDDLDIPIDSISLREFYEQEFSAIKTVSPVFGPGDDMVEKIIEEMKLCGINKLSDISKVIPKDYKELLAKTEIEDTNFSGISRDLMIISDPEKYFSTAWRNSWSYFPDEESMYLKYRPEALEILKKYQKPKKTS